MRYGLGVLVLALGLATTPAMAENWTLITEGQNGERVVGDVDSGHVMNAADDKSDMAYALTVKFLPSNQYYHVYIFLKSCYQNFNGLMNIVDFNHRKNRETNKITQYFFDKNGEKVYDDIGKFACTGAIVYGNMQGGDLMQSIRALVPPMSTVDGSNNNQTPAQPETSAPQQTPQTEDNNTQNPMTTTPQNQSAGFDVN